ncbi:MAG: SpoIID/LytB domain-containing protein, partial [bacterium]
MLVPTISASATDENKPQPWVRVAIVTDSQSVKVDSTGKVKLHKLESSDTLKLFESSRSLNFSISNKKVSLNGTDFKSDNGFALVPADDSSGVSVNGKSYRGFLRVVISNGKLTCVNVIKIEEYLWGVIPAEVPKEWPVECLRAQAIAARTYTLRALEQYPERPFDVYATVIDQVYNGKKGEAPATTKACEDTLGQVCLFKGTPIIAYFHSCAGGWTASSEEMFGKYYPYLRAVPSRDSAVYRWTYKISTSSLTGLLRTNGYSVGTIRKLWVHRFSQEGRAEEIKVVHSDGVALVDGADLRRFCGPANIKSTYFSGVGQTAPAIPDK